MQVIADADNAYWSYIAVERKVRMTEQYKTLMDTLFRQTEAAQRVGMATDNDLLRIDARRSEIEYQLQRARNGADLCRMSLCRIIGVESDTEFIPTDTLVSISAPVHLDDNIDSRPELHLLEKQIEA